MKDFSKKGFAGIKWVEVLAILLLAIVLIAIGSAKDLEISIAVAHPDNNIFGKIFQFAGKLPAYALLGSSGVLFFISYEPDGKKDSKILAWLVLILLPLASGLLYGYDDINQFFESASNGKVIACTIGALLVGAVDAVIYFLFRKGDKEEAYKVGVVYLFTGVVLLLLFYLLKKAGMRPRFSWLYANEPESYADYQPWWAFNSTVEEAHPDALQDNFESWPSAHVGLASMTFLTMLMPRINPKLKGKEPDFFVGAFLWILLTGISRLSDGSHFLSDIGFGLFFGALFSFLVCYLVYLPAPKAEEDTPIAPATESQEAKPVSNLVAASTAEESKPAATTPLRRNSTPETPVPAKPQTPAGEPRVIETKPMDKVAPASAAKPQPTPEPLRPIGPTERPKPQIKPLPIEPKNMKRHRGDNENDNMTYLTTDDE
jgi:membrane-associated phospholipid phosphatase